MSLCVCVCVQHTIDKMIHRFSFYIECFELVSNDLCISKLTNSSKFQCIARNFNFSIHEKAHVSPSFYTNEIWSFKQLKNTKYRELFQNKNQRAWRKKKDVKRKIGDKTKYIPFWGSNATFPSYLPRWSLWSNHRWSQNRQNVDRSVETTHSALIQPLL